MFANSGIRKLQDRGNQKGKKITLDAVESIHLEDKYFLLFRGIETGI